MKIRRYTLQKGVDYPPHNLIREDGRLEKLCPHGIGHTVGHVNPGELASRYTWIHGCDGCCFPWKTQMPKEFGED
jgi:hypothetical protein